MTPSVWSLTSKSSLQRSVLCKRRPWCLLNWLISTDLISHLENTFQPSYRITKHVLMVSIWFIPEHQLHLLYSTYLKMIIGWSSELALHKSACLARICCHLRNSFQLTELILNTRALRTCNLDYFMETFFDHLRALNSLAHLTQTCSEELVSLQEYGIFHCN
jgi:hypothetical protein